MTIYEKWLADNAKTDSPETRDLWNKMVERSDATYPDIDFTIWWELFNSELSVRGLQHAEFETARDYYDNGFSVPGTMSTQQAADAEQMKVNLGI